MADCHLFFATNQQVAIGKHINHAFDLAGQATLASRARLERVESRNVVGRLPGRDARLSGEHVAFIAHLDHLGIGAAVDGDSIYNGAQDNAVGIATLLEAARLLVANPERPKRSMLFVALTAEEKGLLGAFQFAAEPTVLRESLVATINMDMPLPLSDASDVVAIGIEHSTLQAIADRAVAEAGLRITPDPFADEVLFGDTRALGQAGAGCAAAWNWGGRS